MFLIIKVNVLIDKIILRCRHRPVELKKNYGGGLPAYEKCRPLWLPDQEKLSVEIVYNG